MWFVGVGWPIVLTLLLLLPLILSSIEFILINCSGASCHDAPEGGREDPQQGENQAAGDGREGSPGDKHFENVHASTHYSFI